jgi:two-component system sensor histidine kinase UhpB
MSKPLRLLLIEDDEADAELLLLDLRQGGFDPSVYRVDNLDDFRAALGEPWDLIIADYYLPTCTGLDALKVVRDVGLDTPFLLVSGTVGEETAVAAMKAGAADYLLKDHLAKLAPTIERELREAEQRKQARLADKARRESEERLSLAMDLAQLGTYDWDLVTDRITVDDRMLKILGLPPGTVMGSLAESIHRVHPDDRAYVERTVAEIFHGSPGQRRQYRIIRADGAVRWVASKSHIERGPDGGVVRLLGVLQDIHELKNAEQELRASAERTHHLSRQLLIAQETERRRIARELHDETGQGLTAALVSLQLLQHHPAWTSIAGEVLEAVSILETTLQQVRTMALELRPAMLDDLGLVPALKWLLDRMGLRGGFRGRLRAEGITPRLPAELETVCYRVVQEALTNVTRHGKARTVEIVLRRSDATVELDIRDDGAGFDVAAARARVQEGGSLGLLSMEERVTLAGGKLTVDSAPGRGCRISARLPLRPPAPSAEMTEEGARP